MKDEWIKLMFEDIIWRLKPEQKVIFLTILMKANHKGQFITSLDSLASESGPNISIQNVKTAIKNLQNLQLLTNESTKIGRLITVCNWDRIIGNENNDQPGGNKATNKATNKAQTPVTESNTDSYKGGEKKLTKQLTKQVTKLQQTNKAQTPVTESNTDSYKGGEKKLTKLSTEKTGIINNRIYNTVTKRREEGDKRKKEKEEIYKNFLTKTDDKKYHVFVDYLFGNNEVKEPFEKCLSLNNQISPENFNTLMRKYSSELIKSKIDAMENTKDLLKRYTSFYRTLNIWCRNEK